MEKLIGAIQGIQRHLSLYWFLASERYKKKTKEQELKAAKQIEQAVKENMEAVKKKIEEYDTEL